MSTLSTQILVSKHHPFPNQPGFLGEMLISGFWVMEGSVGTWHLIVPENKEVLNQ